MHWDEDPAFNDFFVAITTCRYGYEADPVIIGTHNHLRMPELECSDTLSDPLVRQFGRDCIWCGEPEWLKLEDAWSDHRFLLAGCCEARVAEAYISFEESPEEAAALLTSLNADTIFGADIRRVVADVGLTCLDFELRISPISRADAMAFVKRHHGHAGELPVDRFRAAIWNGPTLLGVVIVASPCARAFNHTGLVEVRRLCLRLDLPDALRWKACSTLYTWAASEAERRGWERIITYTLASETGMSLRYARWKCDGAASRDGKTWNTPSRPRSYTGPTEAKVRWSKGLKPSPAAIAGRLEHEEGLAKRRRITADRRGSVQMLPGF